MLYDVPDDQINRERARVRGRKSLDAIEGESANYSGVPIRVRLIGSEVNSAETYVVREPTPGLLTSLEYVTL